MLVGYEWHGRNFAGTVTALAVVLEDGEDIFVKRGLGVCGGNGWRAKNGKQRGGDDCEKKRRINEERHGCVYLSGFAGIGMSSFARHCTGGTPAPTLFVC